MELTNQQMYKFTKKTMKDMLSSLKVIHKPKTKLNGSVMSAYWFDIPTIIEYLSDIVKEEEIEEYTDDDFE